MVREQEFSRGYIVGTVIKREAGIAQEGRDNSLRRNMGFLHVLNIDRGSYLLEGSFALLWQCKWSRSECKSNLPILRLLFLLPEWYKGGLSVNGNQEHSFYYGQWAQRSQLWQESWSSSSTIINSMRNQLSPPMLRPLETSKTHKVLTWLNQNKPHLSWSNSILTGADWCDFLMEMRPKPQWSVFSRFFQQPPRCWQNAEPSYTVERLQSMYGWQDFAQHLVRN